MELKRVTDIPLIIKQQLEINGLKLKVEELEDIIKNDLYKEFMSYLNESLVKVRLEKENKRLRKQIKTLKEIIKEK